jgi:hypothetical protein
VGREGCKMRAVGDMYDKSACDTVVDCSYRIMYQGRRDALRD